MLSYFNHKVHRIARHVVARIAFYLWDINPYVLLSFYFSIVNIRFVTAVILGLLKVRFFLAVACLFLLFLHLWNIRYSSMKMDGVAVSTDTTFISLACLIVIASSMCNLNNHQFPEQD